MTLIRIIYSDRRVCHFCVFFQFGFSNMAETIFTYFFQGYVRCPPRSLVPGAMAVSSRPVQKRLRTLSPLRHGPACAGPENLPTWWVDWLADFNDAFFDMVATELDTLRDEDDYKVLRFPATLTKGHRACIHHLLSTIYKDACLEHESQGQGHERFLEVRRAGGKGTKVRFATVPDSTLSFSSLVLDPEPPKCVKVVILSQDSRLHEDMLRKNIAGSYTLHGRHHGKPVYRHVKSPHVS